MPKFFFELGIVSGELGTTTIVLSIGIVICYCFETALGIAAKSPQRSEDLQRIARTWIARPRGKQGTHRKLVVANGFDGGN